MATPENDLVTKLSHEIVMKCNLSNIVHVGPCGNQSDFQNFVIVMVNWDISLHTNQVAHQAGAYPCFCSMNRLGIFLYPLDGILFHQHYFRRYLFIHPGTGLKKCHAQEHKTMCPARARSRYARSIRRRAYKTHLPLGY